MRILHLRYAILCYVATGYVHDCIASSPAHVHSLGGAAAAAHPVSSGGGIAVEIRAWLAKDQDCISPPPVITMLLSVGRERASVYRCGCLHLHRGLASRKDRESMILLNVQTRPLQPLGANPSPLASPHRVRLLYRPSGLWQNPALAPELLAVKLRNGKINLYNPTPYHLHMLAFNQHALGGRGEWLYPGRKLSISAPAGMTPSGPFSVDLVNDRGDRHHLSGGTAQGSGLWPVTHVLLYRLVRSVLTQRECVGPLGRPRSG